MSGPVIHLEHLGDLYPDDRELEAGAQIYYTMMSSDSDGKSVAYVAHAGGPAGRYPNHGLRWGSTHEHQLVSAHPLTLVESLGWQECCGRHGFIKDGIYTPTPDSKEPA